MVPQVIFWYFAVTMPILAIFVVRLKNPIHSVLCMLFFSFHTAGLFLCLNAEFLAAVELILYAGAVLVLFVFVVMMMNVKDELAGELTLGEWPMAAALGLATLLMLFFGISGFVLGPSGPYTIEAIRAETNTRALGKLLFTEYIFPFEVASFILLIAIVGAMVLAKKRRDD
ncbi:MAG TPA: NADH-quinone oxidoreductase subunit J [Dissulfurispiraceae bacterium]|nr:NADH-quinone oxidoreductase subunit J [Dissulfurispiraceae bacterium]